MTKTVHAHQPVLLQETLTALAIYPAGIYVDATFGRGGHTRAILQQLNQDGRLFAFDQDPDAQSSARHLETQDHRFHFHQQSFTHLADWLESQQLIGKINGILLDLGVSSPQLEEGQRGFSFLRDGPLDMRMNPHQGKPLSHWLAKAKLVEIVEILKTYGEERYAKRLAQAIIQARDQQPLTTTQQLAKVITQAHPAWEIDRHPATKAFQAFRIFINQELTSLTQVLPQALTALAPQGRLAVISFHSLEDRLVKRFIRDAAQGDNYPKNLPITAAQLHPQLKSLGKPMYPSEAEIVTNPRARSAILRVAEKL